jgi:hypothetical protein
MSHLSYKHAQRHIFLLSFLLIISNCFAQTFSKDDFKIITPPKVNSPEWYKLNNSPNEFSISFIDKKLKISKNVDSSEFEFALPQGRLLAIDRGEFGGGLFYRPSDSLKKNFYVNGTSTTIQNDPHKIQLSIPRESPLAKRLIGKLMITRGNVKSIFRYKDIIYLMGGLAHMGISAGGLIKLDIKNDSFTVSKVLDLEDAPMAMSIYHDSIFIATYERFYIITNLKKELVFKELFWAGLYPNSISVIDEDHIYIGMRSGYAKINLSKKKLDFYKYIK